MIHSLEKSTAPKAKETINPKVKKFTTILKQIEKLEVKLLNDEERLNEINAAYIKTIVPLDVNMYTTRLGLIKAAYYAMPILKYTKRETETITEVMVEEMDEILSKDKIVFNDEECRIYETLARTTVKETLDEMNSNGFELLKESMENEGIYLDYSKYDIDKLGAGDPDEMNIFFKDVLEYQAKKLSGEYELNDNDKATENKKTVNKKTKKESKKTKAQLAKEEEEKQRNEFEKMTLKSLYVSLAKLLHPDTEQDELLRNEKQEWMKQLTVAYQDKNMAAMLKIEMHWLKESKFDPATAPDQKFKAYISFLSERKQDLEMELEMLYNSTRYMYIDNYKHCKTIDAAYKLMEAEVKKYTLESKKLNLLTKSLIEKKIETIKKTKKSFYDHIKLFLKNKEMDAYFRMVMNRFDF
jgi:hypothetical protein